MEMLENKKFGVSNKIRFQSEIVAQLTVLKRNKEKAEKEIEELKKEKCNIMDALKIEQLKAKIDGLIDCIDRIEKIHWVYDCTIGKELE
jgi:shikimate 5-dehydrogenase